MLEAEKNKPAVVIAALVMKIAAVFSFAATLKKEPPMGALREGQVVFVDDGTCSTSQVKRVVGGNHTNAGGTKNIVRTSSCISR